MVDTGSIGCLRPLESGPDSEPLDKLLKNPDRLLVAFVVVDADTFEVLVTADCSEWSARDTLEPASDLSDRLPVKTAARRRMAKV